MSQVRQLTPEHEAATISRLQQAGLTTADVAGIRARAGPITRAYNAVHWDWHHLGLADSRRAHRHLDPLQPAS